MLVALILLNDCHRPFCAFGGVVDTPEGITYDDMDRLYRQWSRADSPGAFADWLVRNHGCKEIQCGFAILELDEDETGENDGRDPR